MGRPVAHVLDLGVAWIDREPTVAGMAAFVRRAVTDRRVRWDLAGAARLHVADDAWLWVGDGGGPELAPSAQPGVGCRT